MQNISQSELNSIREVVTSHVTMANKLNDYADKVSDGSIKTMFTQAAAQAHQSAQNLISVI